MRLQYYISLKKIAPNRCIYGILEMVEKKPFDYACGTIEGNSLEINGVLTQRMIEKNKDNALRTSLSFKYDDLSIAKQMLYKFNHNKEYVKYSIDNHLRLDASPSVFLSDLTNLKPLQDRMIGYEQKLRYYCKNNGKSL